MEFLTNGSSAATVAFASGIRLDIIKSSEENKLLRYVATGICFAVNLVLILVVSCSRQLHLPRHVFWVGISITVEFCSANYLLELFVFESGSATCFLYETSIGIFYPSLLLLLSLAGLDRYLAIRYYKWYKRKMNNKKAIMTMLSGVTLNALLLDSPFWTGHLSASDCLVDLLHLFWIATWCVVLGAINMVLQIKIFIVSRDCIRQYFSASSKNHSPPSSSRPGVIIDRATPLSSKDEGAVDAPNSKAREAAISFAVDRHLEQLSWIRRKMTMDRLDFRAALLLSANVLPFWICTFPLGINGMAMYLCVCFDWPCSANFLIKTDSYLKFTTFLPAVCMPVMYMLNSTEFKRASGHLFWKIESRANSLNSRSARGPPMI